MERGSGGVDTGAERGEGMRQGSAKNKDGRGFHRILSSRSSQAWRSFQVPHCAAPVPPAPPLTSGLKYAAEGSFIAEPLLVAAPPAPGKKSCGEGANACPCDAVESLRVGAGGGEKLSPAKDSSSEPGGRAKAPFEL